MIECATTEPQPRSNLMQLPGL